jgi:hypothetical protein
MSARVGRVRTLTQGAIMGEAPSPGRTGPSRTSADTKSIAGSAAVGATYLAAGGLAASFGFDFGMRAGGLWLAVIVAVQAAVFATLMVDAARDARRRHRRRAAAGRGGPPGTPPPARPDGCHPV